MSALDDVDKKIIDYLSEDSRASFRKIAKKLGLSVDTITRRYQKLLEENVIRPTITIDPTKLGYEAFVFFSVKIESQTIVRNITNEVAKIPDITAVMETTGEYDLTVIALTKSFPHAFKIGEKISNVCGVRRVSIGQIDLSPFENSMAYPPPFWHNLDIGPK